VISVPERKDAVEASKIMVNAVRLAVPSRVDVEVGPNWGSAK
jgi:DNA polymerase I-like protein with 3'-5' exonuclease and polymerase domains